MNAVSASMRGLSATDRRALGVGAILVGLMLGYSLLVRPLWHDVTADRAALEQQTALLARELSLVQGTAQLARSRTQIARTLGPAQSRLLSGDSVSASAALAAYVGDVASASGLHLVQVETRAPSPNGALIEASVEVRGQASFAQLLAFLRTIESSAALLDVRSLRVDRGARGGPLGDSADSFAATIVGIAAGQP